MTKLPALKPRQVIHFLEQSGFVLDHSSGSHFVFYHPATRRRARLCLTTIATCQRERLCLY
ncbi:MAG: type II toxin-antitoxin system HicA family toxin [Candidatus Sulfotelmatobacter sp.]